MARGNTHVVAAFAIALVAGLLQARIAAGLSATFSAAYLWYFAR